LEQECREYEIGRDIFGTSKILRRYIDSLMPCEAVSGGQGRILGWIVSAAAKGETLCQRDIEEALHIRGSSVTSTLQLMEKKGLITRACAPGDARRKRLLPTPDGILVNEQVRSAIVQAEAGMLEQVTEEELEVLRGVLEKLRVYAAEHNDKEHCKGGMCTC
jgi:DNA-binding MarR family transcriptional regulator